MKCPKCSAGMEQVHYSGYEIDRCTECKGLWLQISEFESLIRDDWLAEYIDAGPGAGKIKLGKHKASKKFPVNCPDCASQMDQLADENQPHIVYERCPKDCGVFFDAGEFKDLAKKTFWDKFKPRATVST